MLIVHLMIVYMRSYAKKENTAFWKAWPRRFCSSKLKPASTINGSSGDENIRHEFTHYLNLLSPQFLRMMTLNIK